MKTVKVMLEGKNGKEFEALVPIEAACLALYCGAYYNDARISRMGYSVVRKIYDFFISKATGVEEINEEIDQVNYIMEVLTSAMEREERMVGLNGIELYRD